MRTCSRCKIEKEAEFFPKNKSSPDGLKSICKECYNLQNKLGYNPKPRKVRTKEEILQQRQLLYKERYKEKNRYTRLKTKYGISKEEYEEKRKQQSGKCACCGKIPDTLYVDHDHNTGIIRGLLCQRCNTGIGILGDTLNDIQKALNYLKGE